MPLTAVGVKNAKPGRHPDGDGLYLLVKESGAKSWLLRVQVGGKRRDFGLGSATILTLAEARASAAELRKFCKAGGDPIARRNQEKQARIVIPTFRDAAQAAFAEQKGGWRNPKHRAQWLSSLEAYAFPFIGDAQVDQVDGPKIRDLLLPIWLAKPETARRVRQRVGAVLDWAHVKGLRATEAPMRSLSKGLPRQPKKGESHHAAMPYADAPSLYARLVAQESVGRLALRFVMLTAARSGEVRGATWEEIDLEDRVWAVPGTRMKAGRTHLVPLSDAAVAVLQRAALLRTEGSDALVFPGLRSRPLSDMTLLKVLRANGGDGMTVHGFRSSFRDWAAECTNTAGDVVEAALAHTIANKVEAAYRRTNYLEKRRDLMAEWAKHLTPA